MWIFEFDNGVTFEVECTDMWANHMMKLYSYIVSAVKVDS